jgi:phosphoglucomutase
LLSAEIAARTGRDPGERYAELTQALGQPVSDRVDAAATVEQKKKLSSLSPQQVSSTELAGDRIEAVLSHAPGNGAAIGGVKVVTQNGWFAARPSGTENIYKIYGESFKGAEHLGRILEEAQQLVDKALSAG